MTKEKLTIENKKILTEGNRMVYIPDSIKINLTKLEKETKIYYKSINAGYSKDDLANNVRHLAKIEMSRELIKSAMKDLYDAVEIPNYSPGVSAYIQLDPMTGHQTLDYQLITVKADGVVNTHSIPWYVLHVAYNSVKGDPINPSKIDRTNEVYTDAIKELGLKCRLTKKFYNDITLPHFGKLVNLTGDVKTILQFETLGFKKDGKLATYSKFLYNGIDSKSFELASTLILTPSLLNSLANMYSHIKDILDENHKKTESTKVN